jgi:GT2 family glycosyltransferase
VFEQGFPLERMELVVVDDGSSPEAAELNRAAVEGLGRLGLRRTALERNPAPRNVAAARAQVLAAVAPDADWVLSLDDDALLEPGALGAMLAAGEDPAVAIVGPRVDFASSPGLLCSGPNFVGRWTARYTMGDPDRPGDCDWMNTTCWLIRGSALRRLEGFYPGYFTCHEDVDFCLQAAKAGYRVVYEPSAVVRHDMTPGLLRPGRLYYLFRNKALVVRRNFSGLRLWTALAFFAGPSFALNLFRALFAGGRLGSLPEVAAAYRDGLRGREGPRRGDG